MLNLASGAQAIAEIYELHLVSQAGIILSYDRR